MHFLLIYITNYHYFVTFWLDLVHIEVFELEHGPFILGIFIIAEQEFIEFIDDEIVMFIEVSFKQISLSQLELHLLLSQSLFKVHAQTSFFEQVEH